MAVRVFLDANVLLDFTLKRTHYSISRQIFELAENGEIDLFTSPAIVHITAYWLTKAYGKTRAKELLRLMMEQLYVIDASHEITLLALHSDIEDVEDAIQYFTAVHHKLQYFLTWDKGLIKNRSKKPFILSPEQFLDQRPVTP